MDMLQHNYIELYKLYYKRAPVAQVIVHPTSRQEVPEFDS